MESEGGEEMAWQLPEGMDEYLKSTEFCESDNKEIKEKARELVKDAATQKEAALNIFHFARDSIRFGLDFTDFRASHALKTRLGFCIHKPNLQIALLRAVGIPARSHRVGAKKETLQGIVSDLAYKASPDVLNHHIWCECHLSGKWISCEALFDKELFEGMREKGVTIASQIPTIDWDGENDLIVVKPWVVKDFGTFDSLDDFWREIAKQYRPTIRRRIGAFFSNRYTDSLRKR
jgi:hypothetical protein